MSTPGSYVVILRPQYRKGSRYDRERREGYYRLPIDIMTYKTLRSKVEDRFENIDFKLDKYWINRDTGRVVVQVTPYQEFLNSYPDTNAYDVIPFIKETFDRFGYSDDSDIDPADDAINRFSFEDTTSKQTVYAFLDLFIEDIKPLPTLAPFVIVSPVIPVNPPSYSPVKPMTFGPISTGRITSPSRPGQPSPLILPLPPSFGTPSSVSSLQPVSPQPVSPTINTALVSVPIHNKQGDPKVALPVGEAEPLKPIFSDITFGNNLLSVGPARMDTYFKRKADASVHLFVFRPINGTPFSIKIRYGPRAIPTGDIKLVFNPPDPLNKGYKQLQTTEQLNNLADMKMYAEHNPFISALLNSIELVQ